MDGISPDVRARVESTVATGVADDTDRTVTLSPDCLRVELPDRTLLARRRDGPDGVDHWTLELAADGATVSKFGPFDGVAALCDRLAELLDSDVGYTVCCDG
jgi:hypothetical protein